MDPASLMIASLTLTGVGTAVSMIGAKQTADAQSASANYTAAVARNNAIIAENLAVASEQRGRVLAQSEQEKTAQIIGAQRAGMAASGVNIDWGSPLRMQEDTARVGALNVLTTRHNAALDAYGYRTQGMNYMAQAGLEIAKAGYAEEAGNINMITSLASGASSVAGNWAKWKQVGVPAPKV